MNIKKQRREEVKSSINLDLTMLKNNLNGLADNVLDPEKIGLYLRDSNRLIDDIVKYLEEL